MLPSACPDGKWGSQCSRLCNCDTPTTVCEPVTGCTECPPGFKKGGDCHEDKNECNDNPCGSNANCTNTVGTFRCDCHEGYVQHNLTACVGMYALSLIRVVLWYFEAALSKRSLS